jgi:hypothetical protein
MNPSSGVSRGGAGCGCAAGGPCCPGGGAGGWACAATHVAAINNHPRGEIKEAPTYAAGSELAALSAKS